MLHLDCFPKSLGINETGALLTVEEKKTEEERMEEMKVSESIEETLEKQRTGETKITAEEKEKVVKTKTEVEVGILFCL